MASREIRLAKLEADAGVGDPFAHLSDEDLDTLIECLKRCDVSRAEGDRYFGSLSEHVGRKLMRTLQLVAAESAAEQANAA